MTRTVPGTGATINPIFDEVFGVRAVEVTNGGSGYSPTDPPRLTITGCGTPTREAILYPIIDTDSGLVLDGTGTVDDPAVISMGYFYDTILFPSGDAIVASGNHILSFVGEGVSFALDNITSQYDGYSSAIDTISSFISYGKFGFSGINVSNAKEILFFESSVFLLIYLYSLLDGKKLRNFLNTFKASISLLNDPSATEEIVV